MIIDFYIDNDFSKNQRPQQVTVRCSKDEFSLTIKNQNRDWKEYKTTGLKTFGEIVNWVKSTYSQTETGTFNGLMSLDIFARNKSDRYENRGNLIVKEDNAKLRLTYCPFKQPVIVQTLSLNSNWKEWTEALKDTDKIWEEIEEMAELESQKEAKDTTSLENIVFHHQKLWLDNDYKIHEMKKDPQKYKEAIASLQSEQKEIEAEVDRLDMKIRSDKNLPAKQPTTPTKKDILQRAICLNDYQGIKEALRPFKTKWGIKFNQKKTVLVAIANKIIAA